MTTNTPEKTEIPTKIPSAPVKKKKKKKSYKSLMKSILKSTYTEEQRIQNQKNKLDSILVDANFKKVDVI